MELRDTNERKRDLREDTSFWNPLFLQMYFTVKAIKSFFYSLNEKELTIYDFGCGTKPYSIFCDNKKIYIGIDIDIKNKEADILADVSDLPVKDEVADIVVSFYLLEHVNNPQKVIMEKYRILKKGGELFMLVPLYWEEHEQPYDFFRFTRYGIEVLLKNAGFKEIIIKELNTSPSIIGMNLTIFFNKRVTRFMIPILNYLFLTLELRNQKKAKLTGKNFSNVMSFSVKAKK